MVSTTIMRMCNTARMMSAHKKKRKTNTEGRQFIGTRLLRTRTNTEVTPTPHMARLATPSRQGRISNQFNLPVSEISKVVLKEVLPPGPPSKLKKINPSHYELEITLKDS